jgi:hypothetical protein
VDAAHHTHDHPPPGGSGPPIGGGQECVVCPVCVLLQAVTSVKPEVMEHLVNAARELTLALQAVVESQASSQERASQGLQRIKVE